MKQILKVIKISFASTAFLAGLATAQTGQCHSTGNNGASCTADSQCTGTGTPYCAVLKHIIFIIKENRSLDQFLGRYPGVMGGPVGTASVPYPCVYTPSAAGGCPASDTLPGIAVVNTHKDAEGMVDLSLNQPESESVRQTTDTVRIEESTQGFRSLLRLAFYMH